MNCHFRLLVLVLGLCVFAASIPAFAQQAKGDSEIGLNGAVVIPNSSPSDTTGLVTVSYGYYFRQNDLVGVDTAVILAKGLQNVYLQGNYRHLFPTKDPKIYPFVGAMAGFNLTHDDTTNTNFLGTGQAGIKFFLSQRTALEIAYNLEYINSGSGGFADKTFNEITFGFTYIFGGGRH